MVKSLVRWVAPALLIAAVWTSRAEAQQPLCGIQQGICKQSDAVCDDGYVEDLNVGGCSSPKPVCCLPTSCNERGGMCLQTATCGVFANMGTVPADGCASCCQPPPPTNETCGEKGGDICRQVLECPSGATPLGGSSDCTMCCASAAAGGACVIDGHCAANEPCSCADCSTAERCTDDGPTESTYKIEFLHTDVLGSVRMVTDASGSVVSRRDYYPFGGNIRPETNGRENVDVHYSPDDFVRSQFAGKERDTESGLDYIGARYYAPPLGRFTAPDPGPFNILDPQKFNRYQYGLGSPFVFVDPDGQDEKHVLGALGEKLAATLLRSQGYAVVLDPARKLVTTRGFDMIAVRGSEVLLVDNKAFLSRKVASSASSLTTNLAVNVAEALGKMETLIEEGGLSKEEKRAVLTAMKALKSKESGAFLKVITGAGGVVERVSPRLAKMGVVFKALDGRSANFLFLAFMASSTYADEGEAVMDLVAGWTPEEQRLVRQWAINQQDIFDDKYVVGFCSANCVQ